MNFNFYYSIAVTKHMYLGFNRVWMNSEHPKLKPFIHLQFTTLNVNEVAPVVIAVVCMLIKFWHPFVWDGSLCPSPASIRSPFAQDVIIPNGL